MNQLEAAFKKLKLPMTATPDEIKHRWRTLVTTLHPDRPGGNAVEFDETRRAYKLALEEAEAPKKCKPCAGTGYVTKASGFSTVRIICTSCDGQGYAWPT